MNKATSRDGHRGMTRRDNPEGLREIERVIASTVVFSSDGYVLMGRKDPAKGGVYNDAWHIPGGGVEGDETLVRAAARELSQEVGISLSEEKFIAIPIVGNGAAVKTLKNGERVWCRMEFNRFEVRLDKPASELSEALRPGDDLIELHWFAPEQLADIKQIPGGKEFFLEAGYIRVA